MMKAAVIYPNTGFPQYIDFPAPVAQAGEVLADVKAVAIKHLDKSRASGSHYSSEVPAGAGRIAGGDGVCLLPDGTRVYGIAVNGMLAEKAVIHANRIVPLPEGIDDAVAAALPNAVIGSAMGLLFKADIQPGDVVLVNGATGFTGRVAVQLAKHYGAGKVIGTGRNEHSLQELLSLGADEVLNIAKDDFKAQLDNIPRIDIVIDYLWGKSAELILNRLKGDGSFSNAVRYVSIGSMSGDKIELSAAILRSVNIQLSGSGLGAWTRQQVGQLFSKILPETFELAAAGRLVVATDKVKIADIAKLWEMEVADGRRLVVTI